MSRRRDNFPDNGFEAWGGYMNAKIAKLEEQFNQRAQCEEQQQSDIFRDVCVYVNGYTNPSADEIKILMSKHGGIYHTYQRANDFIIASNLPDTKVKKLNNEIVVKPEWITESIARNRLLDYRNYLLFNKHTKTQPKIVLIESKKEISKFGQNDRHVDDQTKSDAECFDYENVNEKLMEKPAESKLSLDKDHDSCKLSVSKNIKCATKTAVDPNFLSEFYNNSRLHHISQLGAQFKQYVNELRDENDFKFPARSNLMCGNNTEITKAMMNYTEQNFEGGKVIMHIDMDCFFVSVGLRNRPELRGRPVAVTHARTGQPRYKRPGVDVEAEFNLYKERRAKALTKSVGVSKESLENCRSMIPSRIDEVPLEDDRYGSLSEIASCSYEARAKGIKNGMFMGAAVRLCPDLITIPYDFEGYKDVAFTLFNTVAQYTLDIEAVSCDEMYVDCTELIKTMNISVQDLSAALRSEIKIKTGCPCSTGFGGNRLQARLATKHAKPDGQFFLTSDLVHDFMADIKLSDLPGVGSQTTRRLEALGHHTCGSLQAMTLPGLQRLLGHKTGAHLYNFCRGRDDSSLHFHNLRKSVSAEVNYGIRFENQEQCDIFLQQLAGEVRDRMQQAKVKGKTITLKLMVRAEDAPVETAKFMGHGFCDVINKSVTLPTSTDGLETITKQVLGLFKKLKVSPKDLRGVGIQISKLEEINKHQKGLLSRYVSYETKKPESKLPNVGADTEHTVKREHVCNSLEIPDEKKLEQKPNIPSSPKNPTTSTSPSKKRSPVLVLSKSPEGKRRRGRPPKHPPLQKFSSSNFMSKFLQRSNSQLHICPLQELDQEILLQLPDDILQEVLQHYEKLGGGSKETNYCFDTEKKVKISNEKKTEVTGAQRYDTASPVNDLLLISWERMRDMLEEWVKESKPQRRDAEIFADYAQAMVTKRRIDKLSVILRFLKRKVEDSICEEWSLVYKYITETVQNKMVTVYGKKLFI